MHKLQANIALKHFSTHRLQENMASAHICAWLSSESDGYSRPQIGHASLISRGDAGGELETIFWKSWHLYLAM
jgi:hypothetical protein